jgi:hypothetical protein
VKFVTLEKATKPVNDPIRNLSNTAGQYGAGPLRKILKNFSKKSKSTETRPYILIQ